MRPSIIQLRQLVFQRISIEEANPDSQSAGEAVDFDFEGVNFGLHQDYSPIDPEDGSDPVAYLVSLGVSIDNKEGKASPYNINVLALGIVEVSKKLEKEKRAGIAAVNGMSLVYGAIREQVTSLSSRFLPGPMILPTMDFRDYLKVLSPEPEKTRQTEQ